MPRFINLDSALEIHREQITIFGGTHGLRDQVLLESALGQAEQTFATGDLFKAAAQYCFSIARNHLFLDGNKRVAAACMLVFLLLNKVEPTMTSAELFEWTMQTAIGKLSSTALAELLRTHSKKIK
ncbi:MAG: type II toxin-antitoxin system death-on-curing family toxin [Burkholderiales bacterium]|nr:type II toxin-antitoxin system death-on-curing family toxin [Burkholderiales bacterium]